MDARYVYSCVEKRRFFHMYLEWSILVDFHELRREQVGMEGDLANAYKSNVRVAPRSVYWQQLLSKQWRSTIIVLISYSVCYHDLPNGGAQE